MTYGEASYAEVLTWLENTEVEYVPDGKRPGTKSYDRYVKYSQAKTVAEALEFGSKPIDLVHDFEKGLLKRTGGPVRDKPLDLSTVEDTSSLSKTDFIIGRWGYQLARKGMDQDNAEAEDGEAAEGEGASTNKVKQYREAFKKAKLSAKFGVKVTDIQEGTYWAESPSMVAGRSRANVEAGNILEAATAEGRAVTDDEVLRVLRLWVVKENRDRKSVFPDGAKWVHSECVGLLHCSGGRLIATFHSRQYPKVLALMVRWMKDHRPEGHERDFPFTSIFINSAYAARRHRDHLNVGPTIVKAFGNFEGGQLRYWPEDDRSISLNSLRDEDAVLHDVHTRALLIDGNRAHAVEPYTGEERFSLVFFTAQAHHRAPQEVRDQLVELGFPFPDDEATEYAKSLLPPPAGYGSANGKRPRPAEARPAEERPEKKEKKAEKAEKAARPVVRAAGQEPARNTTTKQSNKELLARIRSFMKPGGKPQLAGQFRRADVHTHKEAGAEQEAAPEETAASAPAPAPPSAKAAGGLLRFCATAPVQEAEPARPAASSTASGAACGFVDFADVLSASADESAEAAANRIAAFLCTLAASGNEDAVRAAVAMLNPVGVVHSRVLGAAITEAFGVPCPPTMPGEVLAAKALEGRQRRRPAGDLAPIALGDVALVMAGACSFKNEEAPPSVVERVAKLLGSCQPMGMEVYYVVRALQGKLGPSREVCQSAIARALVTGGR